MSQQEIYQIAHALNKQGKTPSVALIKSQLSVSMPLTAIIKGLQQWQKNPALGESAPETETKSLTTKAVGQSSELAGMQAHIQLLEQQIKQMKSEMALLKSEISQLKAK